jgi:hypothetical protein
MKLSVPRWRFRFTLRTLLVAVFAISVALAVVIAWRKRVDRLTQLATRHATKAQEFADAGWGMQRFGLPSPERDEQARHYWQLHEQHRDFSTRCQQAVWRPWVSIGNEPTLEQENDSSESDGEHV